MRGGTLLRIFLTGRMVIEVDDASSTAVDVPGGQGRRAFAHLVWARGRPVPRDELAEAIWPTILPPAWDAALSSVVSKLRRLLDGVLPDGRATILSRHGGYALDLPTDAWVDIEAAARAIDEAEGALRRGDARAAWGPANVTSAILRRPVLPGEDGAWIDQLRAQLRALHVRALDCLSDIYLSTDAVPLAVAVTTESLTLEPYRESSYQRLIRAHAAAGNRAEALRVYERCRRLLADELGADPSPELQSLYLQLLD